MIGFPDSHAAFQLPQCLMGFVSVIDFTVIQETSHSTCHCTAALTLLRGRGISRWEFSPMQTSYWYSTGTEVRSPTGWLWTQTPAASGMELIAFASQLRGTELWVCLEKTSPLLV